MAYLELSLEAYDNLIKAAGLKASSVARVCEEQGVWEPQAAEEAPPDVAEPDAAQLNLDVPDPGTTYEPSVDEGQGHD